MRIIKFKMWNKDEKKFFEPHLTEVLKATKSKSSNSRLVLLQFTGIRDKKGKEIWEGDIVKYWGSSYSKVVYERGSFVLKSLGDRYKGTGSGFFHNYSFIKSECEVVGNIFENKELLRQK